MQMLRRSFAIAIILVAVTAIAQNRTGGFGFRGAGLSRRPFALARGHRPFSRGSGNYAAPYFYSDYYEAPDFEYAAPEPAPNPAPAAPVKVEPLPDPVLLELHGSQWVRVTNFSESSERALAFRSPATSEASNKTLAPAALVFRDGHTEEICSYSIIGQVIYTKADYWSTGSWTRSIPIADLDIPATLRQNQQRDVNFELPSSPNEVMIRP